MDHGIAMKWYIKECCNGETVNTAITQARTQEPLSKLNLLQRQEMYFCLIPALAVLILGTLTTATQQGDSTVSRLGPALSKTVQELRSVEELVHEIILPQLRHRLASADLQGGKSCVDYPYRPGRNNGDRLTDDVNTLAKLLPKLMNAATFESNNKSGIMSMLLTTAVRKLKGVVSDYQQIKLAIQATEGLSTAEGKGASAVTIGRILASSQLQQVQDQTPFPQAPPTRCPPLVTSALQQYETMLQVYIALVYATRDAIAVNNYYNGQ